MIVCDKCGQILSGLMANRIDIEPHRSGIFASTSLDEDYEMIRKRSFCPDCWLELMSNCMTSDGEGHSERA